MLSQLFHLIYNFSITEISHSNLEAETQFLKGSQIGIKALGLS